MCALCTLFGDIVRSSLHFFLVDFWLLRFFSILSIELTCTIRWRMNLPKCCVGGSWRRNIPTILDSDSRIEIGPAQNRIWDWFEFCSKSSKETTWASSPSSPARSIVIKKYPMTKSTERNWPVTSHHDYPWLFEAAIEKVLANSLILLHSVSPAHRRSPGVHFYDFLILRNCKWEVFGGWRIRDGGLYLSLLMSREICRSPMARCARTQQRYKRSQGIWCVVK